MIHQDNTNINLKNVIINNAKFLFHEIELTEK